ncbi:MAG: LLM class flavin-dependent oxidoreductase [Rhizobium sp.]
MAMPAHRKRIHLNLFMNNFGGHPAGPWLPETDRRRVTDIGFWQNVARKAEAARLDAIFIAGAVGYVQQPKMNPLIGMDMLMVMTALAGVTSRIGLISTLSTTFNQPWQAARQFATLDHISGGRAGWNVVTSTSENEARNFGLDRLPDHADRYDRAREFVEVAMRLWSSFDADALVTGKEKGWMIDPDGVRTIDHKGRWFRVEGPAILPAPPQGTPVLCQAGASEDGLDLAARFSELIYAGALEIDDGRRYRAAIHERLLAHGRATSDLKVLPNLIPIIGRTEAETRAKEEYLNSHIHPQSGLERIREILKIDLSGHAPDAPVPPFPSLDQINGHRGHYQRVADYIHSNQPTVRQLIEWVAPSGRKIVSGTAAELADLMEEWVETGAADGFNVNPCSFPGGFDDFCDLLVPELQRRGSFRQDYEETTLRARFGTRPPAAAVPAKPELELTA